MRTVTERFMRFVRPEPDTGCWLWGGTRIWSGYGHFGVGLKVERAHRVAYTLFVGHIPEGMCVLHKCDNPSCVNPQHLWIGTQLDNLADMKRKGRGRAGGPRKLTKEHVGVIRTCKKGNAELAGLYNVSERTIRDVRRRETWRHVP